MQRIVRLLLAALLLVGLTCGLPTMAHCGDDDCHDQQTCDCACLCHSELAPMQTPTLTVGQLLAQYAAPSHHDRLPAAWHGSIFRPPIA